MHPHPGRVLTTHVGSLPRPPALVEKLRRKHAGEPLDEQALEADVRAAVRDVVARQCAIGVDVVSDGEMGKVSYATYISNRLSGFGGEIRRGHVARDLADYRELAVRLVEINAVVPTATGCSCTGDVHVKDTSELETELSDFRAAVDAVKPPYAFLAAASPGVISVFQRNEHYATEDAYVEAVAEAMRHEYEAIVGAGFMLQLDCPDLAMNRHLGFADADEATFLRNAAMHVEALNHATRNIPAERMRMHVCWGNYAGPHHHDISLEKILPVVLGARPMFLALEGANPRHAHEWAIFEAHHLPEGKVLIPGVIDSTSNYIEHPELVAQRILAYARVVGRERVHAGSDCGFSTTAGFPTVDPAVVWAKLESLVEGAAIATKKLFDAAAG
jgi:5-methyltetrahydropteroyltriglutamate--homocysteine methyltransferase